MQHGQIDARVFHRQLIHVALTHVDIRQTLAFDVTARYREHALAEIDTDATVHARRQDFQDTARTGADVEHFLHRLVTDDVEQLLFDLRLRHV